MPYAITDIIQWAKASQPLARYGEMRRKAFVGASVDEDLDIKISNTRKDVEYEYAQDSTSENLYSMGNYLLSLIGIYLFPAQQATGDGGSISPITPPSGSVGIYPIVVTGADFEADGISYNNSEIVGANLMLFVSGFNNEWQFSPAFFNYTATGIQITFTGFNANAYSQIIIQNFNP